MGGGWVGVADQLDGSSFDGSATLAKVVNDHGEP
jgi:hypothetical protein